VAADLRLAEGRRRVTEPRRLTYDALRHNWSEEYLVVLDPPLADAHAVLVHNEGTNAPEGPYTVTLLDASLQALRDVPVLAHDYGPAPAVPGAVWLPWVGADR
jgi:hypothetical protein